jgi:hypothetical protein
MLINNLGSLKAELARYMFHQRFAPDYDTAVQNFEAACNRRLRVRQMEAVAGLTVLNGDATLPPNYLLWRTLLFTMRTPSVELDYVHPAFLDDLGTGNNPQIFTIEEQAIRIRPVHDCSDYELHYYAKIPTINGNDNNANWLISEHSDIYLFGTLFELFVLGRNAEAGQAYKQMRDEKMAELIQLSALTTGATSSQVRGQGSALGSGGEYF